MLEGEAWDQIVEEPSMTTQLLSKVSSLVRGVGDGVEDSETGGEDSSLVK